MYLAHASTRNGIHIGSTRLHKDVTAAYNLNLVGTAWWVIWPSWSSSALCEFVFENGLADPKDGNPIHGQNIFLDETQVNQFSEKYQIQPFSFHQNAGQTVYIPPNCPHEVG